MNESGYNSTNNCSKIYQLPNIIFQVSYKSSSIISTANYPISPAFPFEQHANHPNKHTSPYNCPLNQSAHNSTNKSSKNCQLPKHHLQVSQNSSSIIPTINHSISSAFPFNQHANPPIIHTSAHNFAENESGYNSTNNCSKNNNYENIIVQASYKSSSIISTSNNPISPAFQFEHHANPLTIY